MFDTPDSCFSSDMEDNESFNHKLLTDQAYIKIFEKRIKSRKKRLKKLILKKQKLPYCLDYKILFIQSEIKVLGDIVKEFKKNDKTIKK